MTVTLAPPYAGPVSRTVAYVVDAAIVSVFATGTVIVIELIASVIGTQARDLAKALVPLIAIALPAMLASYFFVFWGLVGRTPGMALMGVRITSTAGRRASWWSALVRALVLAFFPIGALWCLVDRRRQAIHDKLARTIVVRALPSV